MMRSGRRLIGLTADDRRFLTLSAQIVSLQSMRPDHVFSGMEAGLDKQIAEARLEWNELAKRVDHDSLIRQLAL